MSIALVLFATTTIAYNAFLGENSIAYFERLGRWAVPVFRLSVLVMIALGIGTGSGDCIWLCGPDNGLAGADQLLRSGPISRCDIATTSLRTAVGGRIGAAFSRDEMPEEALDPASWPSEQ